MNIPVKYGASTSVSTLSNMLTRCKEQLAWYQDLKAEPISCRLCYDIKCYQCAWSYCTGRTCTETGIFIKRGRVKRKNRIAQLKRWITKIENDIDKQKIKGLVI